MSLRRITIHGGTGKDGQPEAVRRVDLNVGDVASIVGPTGCGKTTLINDIELFANGNTRTGRRVEFDGVAEPEEWTADPSRHPIALISQHTNFLSDLPVREFLETHASVRHSGEGSEVVRETVDFANELTGEPLQEDSPMTELSGGQTRALLIADAVIIGNSPVILLDEIENAGIHRTRALELLRRYEKLFLFVTHDPRIALLSDYRIVMGNGAMQKLLRTDAEERDVADELKGLDDLLLEFRQLIRAGERVERHDLESRLRALGYIA